MGGRGSASTGGDKAYRNGIVEPILSQLRKLSKRGGLFDNYQTTADGVNFTALSPNETNVAAQHYFGSALSAEAYSYLVGAHKGQHVWVDADDEGLKITVLDEGYQQLYSATCNHQGIKLKHFTPLPDWSSPQTLATSSLLAHLPQSPESLNTAPVSGVAGTNFEFVSPLHKLASVGWGKAAKATKKPRLSPKKVHRFATPGDAKKWAEEGASDWFDELDDFETDALWVYKQPGYYYQINADLRGGRQQARCHYTTEPSKRREWIEGLNRALSRESCRIDRSVEVYRGFNSPRLVELYAEGKLKPGQVLIDYGFVSTSLNKEVAETFKKNGHITITLPAGTKAGYLDRVEEVGELELLLPRRARFRIKKARLDDNGVLHLEAEYLGSLKHGRSPFLSHEGSPETLAR